MTRSAAYNRKFSTAVRKHHIKFMEKVCKHPCKFVKFEGQAQQGRAVEGPECRQSSPGPDLLLLFKLLLTGPSADALEACGPAACDGIFES